MQNKRSVTRLQSGFTLIELITTLVILGICSTLMFGGFANYANVYVMAQSQTIEESSREASLMVLTNLLKHAPTASVTDGSVSDITTVVGENFSITFENNTLCLNGETLITGLKQGGSQTITAEFSDGVVTSYHCSLTFSDNKTIDAFIEPNRQRQTFRRRQTYVP